MRPENHETTGWIQRYSVWQFSPERSGHQEEVTAKITNDKARVLWRRVEVTSENNEL